MDDFFSAVQSLGTWFQDSYNTFSSYVGDAAAGALTGATVGAIASAVTGGNILKGTLVGGGLGLAGGLVSSSNREKSNWSDTEQTPLTSNNNDLFKLGTGQLPASSNYTNEIFPGSGSPLGTSGINTGIGQLNPAGSPSRTPSQDISGDSKTQPTGLIGQLAPSLITVAGSALAGNAQAKAIKEAAETRAKNDIAYLKEQQAFVEKQQNQAIALKRITPAKITPMNWRINIPTLAEGMAISKAQNTPAALPA